MTRKCVVHNRYFANDGACPVCREQYALTNIVGMHQPGPRPGDVMMYRRSAAEIARAVRHMWPGLVGEWTRRDWNQQARAAAYNHMARMIRFERIEAQQKRGA